MRDLLIIATIFVVSGVVYSLWERLQPWHRIPYRALLRKDVIALLTVIVLTALVEWLLSPVRTMVQSINLWKVDDLREALTAGFWLRFVLFYLVWDFSLYVFHWLMHRRWLWPAHKWHHSPQQMWWLAGVRASFLHILIFNQAFFWFWIFELPYWLSPVLTGEYLVRNGWMHLNVNYKWLRYVELLFVTPRYHAIHHSDDPKYYTSNLGSLLTVWDRIFGTFVSPDRIDLESLRYGIDEKLNPVRMAIGI